MCHSRTLSNRINRIQEKAFRIVYNDHISTFMVFLKRDGFVNIHNRNPQLVAIEIYKVFNGISLYEWNLSIKENLSYSIRFPFKPHNIRTVAYRSETLSFLGPKVWSVVLEYLKKSISLNEFKRKIKQWEPDKCPADYANNLWQE